MRRAIEELVQQGYLTKRQGKGTFVNAPKLKRKIRQKDDVQSFSDACRVNGMEPGARVISRKILPADSTEAQFFGVAVGTDLICVERVRTADGVPVMLENNIYVYEDNAYLSTAPLSNQSIFEFVRNRTGRTPAFTDPCTLEIACASPEVARLLAVPVGEPLFYMEAFFFDEQRRPFIIGRQRIVGSRYVLTSRTCVWKRPVNRLTGRFHTVHGANATVQPRCSNQFEIILMTRKAAGNL